MTIYKNKNATKFIWNYHRKNTKPKQKKAQTKGELTLSYFSGRKHFRRKLRKHFNACEQGKQPSHSSLFCSTKFKNRIQKNTNTPVFLLVGLYDHPFWKKSFFSPPQREYLSLPNIISTFLLLLFFLFYSTLHAWHYKPFYPRRAHAAFSFFLQRQPPKQ